MLAAQGSVESSILLFILLSRSPNLASRSTSYFFPLLEISAHFWNRIKIGCGGVYYIQFWNLMPWLLLASMQMGFHEFSSFSALTHWRRRLKLTYNYTNSKPSFYLVNAVCAYPSAQTDS